MKKKTVVTIGTISFLLAAGCFYAATVYVEDLAKEKLFAPVVKVANGREVAPFEPITREDVVVEQEEVDEILPGTVQRVEDVLGKRSLQPLFSGEQVLLQKLDESQLLPGPGKARYEFPLTLLMPVTEVRKGDLIKIWVKYRPIAELEPLPAPATFAKTNPSADLLLIGQLATVKDSNGSEIYTLKPSLLPQGNQIENPFFHASESGKLFDSERKYRDFRAQPTAIPAYIGLNLSDEEYLQITEAMQYGVIQIGTMVALEEEKAL